MRGLLSEKKLEEINKILPVLDERIWHATSEGIEIAIQDMKEKKTLHIALVCLNDAAHRFNQTRVTLHEAFAYLRWYREESKKAHVELTAIYFGKFFADYAALLLYATAEDIAGFIINFLNIDIKDPELTKINKKKNVTSNSAKIGIYIKKKFPDHRITKAIDDLYKTVCWREAIKYRNLWVHEKPPIIHGLGIEYDRENRLIVSEGEKISMGFGGGSKSKYTVDQLLDIVLCGAFAVEKTLSTLIDVLLARREELGKKYKIQYLDK